MSLKNFSNRPISRRIVSAAARRRAPLAVLLSGVLFSASAVCDDAALQSDWLELVKGFKGSTMGAELMKIEEGDTPDMQTIMLAIPKSEGVDRAVMEEVLVVGQRLGGTMPEPSEPLEFTYEWLEDYDNDRYGLVIHLRKDNKWPIRLYFNAAGGFAADATSPGEAAP